jgi:hypothetical protein
LLCHWFCGDGRGDKKGTLGFCTDGFSVSDVDFLVVRLREDLGVETLRVLNHRGHPQILVGRKDEAVRVKTIISKLMPTCCLYKLAQVEPRRKTGRGRKLSDDVKRAISAAKGSGTMRSIADRHGVSVSKVWTIWHEE